MIWAVRYDVGSESHAFDSAKQISVKLIHQLTKIELNKCAKCILNR